jgi:choline kinase
MRYGTTEHDLETLTVENGRIVELGREVDSSAGIDHRYIGVLKFSERVWPRVLKLYRDRQAKQAPWPTSQKSFEQGYMTDLLEELIRSGVSVMPSVTARQWLEFDTERDYEITCEHREKGTLSRYFTSWGTTGP